MNPDTLENYYKNKFNEKIFHVSQKSKSILFIEDLESKVESEEIEKENYKIIKPKRNLSVFSNKCKYCPKSAIKELDRLYYLKYNCCYECYVKFEE